MPKPTKKKRKIRGVSNVTMDYKDLFDHDYMLKEVKALFHTT